MDLTAATLLQLKYRKPNGQSGIWAAVVEGTYSAQYITENASDLDLAGEWDLQLYVETGAWSGHAEIKSFEVYPNIPAAA
jgi:hypothetical protein